MDRKLPKKPHTDGDVSDDETDLGAIPSLHHSKIGSRGTSSGQSSGIGEKKDIFLHFEVLRAGQHKVD